MGSLQGQIKKIQFSGIILLALIFGFAGTGLAAEKYPSEPVRIIVGFKVGGIVDVRARTLQPFFQEALGVTVVVENMEGSGGGIGANFVKKQKPDGYTLMAVQMPSAAALRYTMGQKFDYVKDFKPIYEFSNQDNNFISVRADSAVKTIDDLVKLAKERKVTVALAGYGTNSHIAAAMFAEKVKPKQMVIIPCASSTESMLQVVGGHTDFCVTSTGGAVFKMVEDGKVRGLAIASESRTKSMPQVPTFKEQGYNVLLEGSYGIVGPAGMPADIIKIIEKAFDKATRNEKFIDACNKQGVVSAQIGSEEFTKRTAYWQDLVAKVSVQLKETMEKQ
jgi:tripartite-type tricarboxylate transporter receptor subunit TctC